MIELLSLFHIASFQLGTTFQNLPALAEVYIIPCHIANGFMVTHGIVIADKPPDFLFKVPRIFIAQ